jgi:predicted Zn-dependent protease
MQPSRLDTLRSLVVKDPGNGPARFGLANELVKLGHFEEAREMLLQYLTMHDDEGAAYRLLAQASERLGRVEEAKEAYLRGIEVAEQHGHPGMADEYRARLEDLED